MCRISNIDEDWAVARQFCCFAFEVADDHEDIFHQFPFFLGEKKFNRIFSPKIDIIIIIISPGNCGGRERNSQKLPKDLQ